ncbi:MAG: hypothetical protein WCY19_05130 [Candidatus Gastranaerophilaceae bacterium]
MRKIEVTCSRCGVEFYKSEYYAKLSTNHYCSNNCRNNGSKPKNSYKGEEIKTIKKGHYENI